MKLFADLAFGVLQGLTEFLPVSSSGHLVILHEVLGITSADDLAFDAVLQLGTMLALLVYFRQDLWRLACNSLKWLKGTSNPQTEQDIQIIQAIIIGTIPALGLGLLLQHRMEHQFRHAWLVAIVLLLGSGLMAFAESRASLKEKQIRIQKGFIIGLFQCLALVPGMSRSGATISGGLLSGLTRESATRFSFLLSIPIISGSGLLKLHDLLKNPSLNYSALDLAIGFFASAIIGYISIAWLLRFVKTHSLKPFIWYRLGLALLVLVWTIAS